MIKVGDIVDASIKSIKDFGAFADFGEGVGLIYFTQIVPKVEYGDISRVLVVGQNVKCRIVQIKPDGKVSLSMSISVAKEQKQSRRQIIESVRNDIIKMASEDTSVRAIWKNLIDIQHYMLMYMQGNISLRRGSACINPNVGTLTAEIDMSVHFENFKKEVRRIFDADVDKHLHLTNYWYFETDVELHSPSERTAFSETSGHMYVVMGENPVIEIIIKSDSEASNKIIVERLQSYYPQMDVLSDCNNELYISIPYKDRRELNDIRIELSYALPGIRNGIQDEIDDTQEKNGRRYEAVHFNYEIIEINEGHDRFLLTMNPEALMDEEGLRFGNFKGQNFIIPDGEGDIPVGILCRIEYPRITFKLNDVSMDKISSILKKEENLIVAPDINDMTGEIEKINRLRDSFEKITEHPELLSNPRLSSYLFDASKATSVSQESIVSRVDDIKNNLLNLHLNDSQIIAIAKAVEAEDLSIIQGPPGTGKSTAIAELIWQLIRKNPKGKILLTSEANLAVDNALDKLKSSTHNIVKPIRIASGDKFSAEGLSYSVSEMKKWAGVELNDIEIEEDSLIKLTDEYRSFNPQNLVLNRWMMNIYRRSEKRLSDDLKKQWFDILHELPLHLRKIVFDEYRTHSNVIGATCSAITDKNYSASERFGTYVPSRFIKKYWSVFKTNPDAPNPQLIFDVVIQDEASKATPAELSLPLSYGKKAVIIGDHRQLPPNLDKEDILFKLHMQRLKSKSKEERDSICNLECKLP